MEDDYIKMEIKDELDYLKMEALGVGKTQQNKAIRSEDGFQGEEKTQKRTDFVNTTSVVLDRTRQSMDMQNSCKAPQGPNESDSNDQISSGSDKENGKDVDEENNIFCEKEILYAISPAASTECYAQSSKLVVKHQMNQIKEKEENDMSNICGMKDDSCQQHPNVVHPNNSLAQTYSQREHKLICTGITAIEGDKIVIVTEYGQIMVLRPDGLFLFLREFDESFGDVTAVADNEIAASCGFRVRFFFVHGTEIKEREEKNINFQYEETTVHGISYSAQKLLMSCNLQSVVSSQPPLLKLYDMKRKVANTIENSQLKYPERVLLNTDASKIFVVDQFKKTISCLDTKGTVLWETTETNSPASFVLSKDFLLIAFEESVEIKCFSSLNGNFLKSVSVTDCLSPKTLLLAKNSSCLILCPCEHVINDMSNFVFFANIEHVRKHSLASGHSHKNMLKKLFPWAN